MMVNLTHWYKEDYFTYLNQNFKHAVLALEYLGISNKKT